MRTASLRVKPKQSLGQNFLIDDNIARNIVRDLRPAADDVVLEIGPGHGALTKLLAGKVRHVLAVEIDDRIVEELRPLFSPETVTILHQDFLETHLSAWQHRLGGKLRLVGNIPYHLTSAILFKAFDERQSVSDLTLMVQREVARRIAAPPGSKEYGILSVFSQFFGVPRILFSVSRNCFYPKPNVSSSVIQVKLHDRLPFTVGERAFQLVVKAAFNKRRKTLRGSLSYLPLKVRDLSRLEFPLDKRPEELTVAQFVDLARRMEPILA